MTRPDYCPVANEPCQAMCDDPCSLSGLDKLKPIPGRPDADQRVSMPASNAQEVVPVPVHLGRDGAEHHLQTASSALPHGGPPENHGTRGLDDAHICATQRARERASALICHPLAHSTISEVEYSGELLKDMVDYTDRLRREVQALNRRLDDIKREVARA